MQIWHEKKYAPTTDLSSLLAERKRESGWRGGLQREGIKSNKLYMEAQFCTIHWSEDITQDMLNGPLCPVAHCAPGDPILLVIQEYYNPTFCKLPTINTYILNCNTFEVPPYYNITIPKITMYKYTGCPRKLCTLRIAIVLLLL